MLFIQDMGDEGFMQCTSNGTSVTGELMQMSTINCASVVHWLHANVFHLLTVLLYSYIEGREGGGWSGCIAIIPIYLP